ncbi:conserved Plasmodium protein, unknown function [Plasmodium knowlesi strain H]|uniref:Uncharacterized protein n=3 Tax=Plasmodium knowlesi TaxID=5850 RepID=A0A5K1UMT1_PLAKH|nr:conserved Plasmodium protein, unknown function [Plasmodium knowlesi strain H]OTN65152.1 Uncharacterized protein PKNOH_S120129800 [Plasmodium knowlesi]CAA9988161.1 conserved Plasmodium protein, unknown function [Plasmodium knowlesi strain H]SBO20064.1 conserved Plasmodium protein, unknown function [Plasmodium knowlesi strain H]SBO20756.1 conserved Plasmodium protein, unknown function [Plasmodium knowlesi strain H]VVS77635.1 conserved Plasmodium protein, unknown function [Plasmodium knowlesi |eukprot:XP_002259137.1 hypothetical protein, conserved in Plasmodium species [Plasmodium knowlesi strain H]
MDGKEGPVNGSQVTHRKAQSRSNAGAVEESSRSEKEGRDGNGGKGGTKENGSEQNSGEPNGQEGEKIKISTRSIVLFQVLLFLLFFFVLLIGSFNFSFKLFQVREKHLYELLNNIKDLQSCGYTHYRTKTEEGREPIRQENLDQLINCSNDPSNESLNFKYYFTRGKHYKKTEKKLEKMKKMKKRKEEKNADIKIFICLNKKKKLFHFTNFYDAMLRSKKCVLKIVTFFFNEIWNALFAKELDISNHIEEENLLNQDYVKFGGDVAATYARFNKLMRVTNSYRRKYYVDMESLFYLYLDDICYYHDFALLGGTPLPHDQHKLQHSPKKKDITLLIKHISKYLEGEVLLNMLHTLYLGICVDGAVLANSSKWGEKSLKEKFSPISLNNAHILEDIKTYEGYYRVYHKMENMRNTSRYVIFLSRIKKKIKTIASLKSLNGCFKRYIANLKTIPFYFFLDNFFDTPCYVYNKLISNILRYYYKGIFLYFIILLGCIHVFFSPFPITLVHFRRFFIYFLIIMYRLFILYFIPSIIQYIIYKFHYFKDEEHMHIFDYSDHVILFSTLLFIISLETKAIEYTIRHQKVSSDYFHFKYNRKLCVLLLKFILFYYYVLIFFFLYTSYFTSKYFHTTNEIFVAYFFSTFSIFFIFYFCLYKNYFSFYSIGITSYVHKNALHSPPHSFHASPYIYSAYASLRDKFPVD